MNMPIRHHYIPQFILRNFCYDRTHLYYYESDSGHLSVRETRDVFMVRNLYRDEINHPDDVMGIENDFARFEREVADIINGRFLQDKDVIVSMEEFEKLKLFFALMGFRSEKTGKRFGSDAPKENRRFYSVYQKNGNLTDFWKRNLGYLVNCRSLKEVLDHPAIDDPIKVFMIRDVFGCFGRYLCVCESMEPYEFVIGDAYPTVITGTMPDGQEVELYSIFPISSKRMILLPDKGVEGAPIWVRRLRECVFTAPSNVDDTHIKLHVRRLYGEEVSFVNNVIVKNSKIGVTFRNKLLDCFPTTIE